MSGHVMLDLHGLELTPEEKELLKHPQTGGVILFSRNYESKHQLKQLNKSIKNLAPHCLIAVDQEGGRVQRFRQDFVSLPPFKSYGDLYNNDPAAAIESAEKMSFIMAQELKDVGVDLSFSPVLDLDYCHSEVIGDRSFHRHADIVAELGAAFIKGMNNARMPATGKHYPGHGHVSADSHHLLPIDTRTFEEISREDLQPFVLLSSKLNAIMPAHILYQSVDENPTCFSKFWLQDILRNKLNFDGVIFSDDLSMAGAAFIPECTTRAEKALLAGCDMVLVCNQRDQSIKVIEHLEKYQNSLSSTRLQNLFAN